MRGRTYKARLARLGCVIALLAAGFMSGQYVTYHVVATSDTRCAPGVGECGWLFNFYSGPDGERLAGYVIAFFILASVASAIYWLWMFIKWLWDWPEKRDARCLDATCPCVQHVPPRQQTMGKHQGSTAAAVT